MQKRSAGFEEGDLAGLSADVVFLGIGGLGSQAAHPELQFQTLPRYAPVVLFE